MRKLILSTALVGAAAVLSACTATLPAAPSVAVMPGKGKTFEMFQNDNAVCMNYARAQIGSDPQQNASDKTVAGAATGAILGAAAGAAIGDSSRAAGVGAGTGMLLGAAAGSNNGVMSSQELQRRYDIAYEQCMYAKGNQLPPASPSRYYSSPEYSSPGYSAPGYYPPPPANYPPPPRY